VSDTTLTPEREALAFFLAAQRASVLAIVDGLSEEQWRRTIVPSGWTPAGLIEHLGDAERVWFQYVVAGESTDEPGDAPTRTVAGALSYYRACIARSDDILDATSLDARPAARPTVDIGITDEVITVRDVVLHMIEETARHAGHLDIARELIDGRTGLGPR
jgi:uncharacterized damage-inducible protein DinB